MLKDIQLIIYDLDGTLIDSTEAIVSTFNNVLCELGEPKQPAETITEMIGLPLTEMFKRCIPSSKHQLISWAWNRYAELYGEVAPRSTVLLPTVNETLRYFKEVGLKQSIATTKRKDVALILIEKLGIGRFFDLILGITDVAHPKPEPDIILKTLNRLNVHPSKAVFVEDTTIGLEAGKRAGVNTVAVTTGTHDREKLHAAKPDYIIDRLDELRSILDLN